MQLAIVGAGKMGAGMTRRLLARNHSVLIFDTDALARQQAQKSGAHTAETLSEVIGALGPPRVVWVMVPASHVHSVITELTKLLEAGDLVVDGGNTYFKDSQAHGQVLAKRGIHFIDAGVSGGVAGETAGYAIMMGGSTEAVAQVQPLITDLIAPDAFAHVGPVGAGHFVKMVHNAVEYGMMQAIAEGFDLLKNGPYGALPLQQIAVLWSQGTIIRSFLMELAARALKNNETLADVAAYVDDSGEGRWSVQTAVDHAVPFWVNTAALYARFDSRQPDSFAAKLVAALRKEFGGHSVKKNPNSQ